MLKEPLSDVLAQRYASRRMVYYWTPGFKIPCERQLWIATLRAQRTLGLNIPPNAVEAYEAVVEDVNLASIARRELRTRQDVKARIEEFNALATEYAGINLECVHEGFTSRDLTENVEQLQIFRSMDLVRDRAVAVLTRLAHRATEFAMLDMCGRSHNVPGQEITFGKRFANIAEEMLLAFDSLEYLMGHYPLRGIKGPMGTQKDMVNLLGSPEKALKLEQLICKYLGFTAVFDSVGQVYPRSLDFQVLSVLTQLASAPANFAKMIRLMAGHELAHEGFGKGQTGSTAMPHKMNSRTCERISGLSLVLGGFLEMVKGLLGDQWLEGDVSCSVVRRVALPGAFFAIDGIFESVMTVLDEMAVFPGMIERELRHYLPFLSTTNLLVAAVKEELGRETAHGIIKEYALDAIESIRAGRPNSFVDGLSGDYDFPLNRDEIEAIVSRCDHGLAPEQVLRVCGRVGKIVDRFPDATMYKPEPIL